MFANCVVIKNMNFLLIISLLLTTANFVSSELEPEDVKTQVSEKWPNIWNNAKEIRHFLNFGTDDVNPKQFIIFLERLKELNPKDKDYDELMEMYHVNEGGCSADMSLKLRSWYAKALYKIESGQSTSPIFNYINNRFTEWHKVCIPYINDLMHNVRNFRLSQEQVTLMSDLGEKIMNANPERKLGIENPDFIPEENLVIGTLKFLEKNGKLAKKTGWFNSKTEQPDFNKAFSEIYELCGALLKETDFVMNHYLSPRHPDAWYGREDDPKLDPIVMKWRDYNIFCSLIKEKLYLEQIVYDYYNSRKASSLEKFFHKRKLKNALH